MVIICIWEKMIKNPNDNSYHLGFRVVPRGTFSLIDFNDDKQLYHNHHQWANRPDYFHLHFEAE